MKANIVRIGNSRGVRLPKAILEQCHLEDTVELEVKDNHLVIRPVQAPRSNWEQAFADMAQKGDDMLLDQGAEPLTEWDKREWQW